MYCTMAAIALGPLLLIRWIVISLRPDDRPASRSEEDAY
jgi:hypothetical protein